MIFDNEDVETMIFDNEDVKTNASKFSEKEDMMMEMISNRVYPIISLIISLSKSDLPKIKDFVAIQAICSIVNYASDNVEGGLVLLNKSKELLILTEKQINKE